MPVCLPKGCSSANRNRKLQGMPRAKQHARCQGGFPAEVGIGAVVEKETVQQEGGGVTQRKSQHAGKQCQQQVLKEYLRISSPPVAPKALRTPISAIRLRMRESVMLLRLMAGTSNRMAITSI